MKKILILGAFDRYNYGDLLFPYMIEYQLGKDNKNYSFEYFGIINSDLSIYGGKKTLDIASFYKHCNNENESVEVIIAGGESLNVTWDSLLRALNQFGVYLYKAKYKLGFHYFANFLAKKLMNGQTLLPFTFCKSDFKSVNNVLLNSLGGSGFNSTPLKLKEYISKTLKKIDYISVRDEVTFKQLADISLNPKLYPDSAILMSEVFPIEFLSQKVSNEVKNFVDLNSNNYFFFQTNDDLSRRNHTDIVNSLNMILSNNEIKACFCPIGKALGHSDQTGLNRVISSIDFPVKLFDEVTIWDIMYLIANSKIYIGTSLHGAITAMSFKKPYIGLKVKKLDSYLKTWGVSGLNSGVNFNEMPKRFDVAMDINFEELEDSLLTQAGLAKESFLKMSKVIDNK